MASSPTAQRIALGVGIPALALFALGAAGFINGFLDPIPCSSMGCFLGVPLRGPSVALTLLLVGCIVFVLASILVPQIFHGQPSLVASGVLLLILGGATLEVSASYMWGDFLGWWNVLFFVSWLFVFAPFGTGSLLLLAVGARHWWGARTRAGGFATGSAHERRWDFREGVLLVVAGSGLSVLDVALAGCVSSMSCRPVPMVPLGIPLLMFVAGVGLILAVVWRPRPERPRAIPK